MAMGRRVFMGVVGTIFVVVIPLIAMSCSRARETAEAASQEFRARITRSAYSDIVKSAAPEFQNATTELDFANTMEGVKQLLGPWQSSEAPTWKVFAGISGQTVTLVYKSHFERGAAIEEFVWRIQGGRPALRGYHVKSSALVAQ
jgi:hypothetical protein